MDERPPVIPSTMKVSELFQRITDRDPELNRRQASLIVDAKGSLAGIITRNDMLRALEQPTDENLSVLDAGTQKLIVTYPDELLLDAVTKMAQHNIGRLPVVNREDETEIAGYIGRSSVMAARRKKIEEEEIREHGFVGSKAHVAP